MADPNTPENNERDMLRSAVSGMDASDAKRKRKQSFADWDAAKEKARIALMKAQTKDTPGHTWKGHFDDTRTV